MNTLGTLLWSANHETGNISEWQSGGKGGNYLMNPQHVLINQISTERARTGIYSIKTQIDAGLNKAPLTIYARLTPSGEPTQHLDAIYTCWYHVSNKFDRLSPSWHVLMEWKPKYTNGLSYPVVTLGFGVRGGNGSGGNNYIQARYGQEHFPPGGSSYSLVETLQRDVPINQWFRLQVRYIQSTTATGRVSVWLDNDMIYDTVNLVTRPSTHLSGATFTEMIWGCNNYASGLDPAISTVFLDDATIHLPSTAATNPPQGTVTIGNITVGQTTATIPYTYNNSDQTGFQYRLNGGSPQTASLSPISLTGLSSGTAYTVEVRAINSVGNGTWSAVSNFTTNSQSSTLNLTNGLVSAYSLDTNASLVDDHGANNGTNTDTTLVTGRVDNALSYNGATSISHIPHSASLGNIGNNFTLMADIYPTANGQSSASIIVGKLLGTTGQEWSLALTSSNNIRLRSGASGSHDVISTATVPLNQWSRIIGRYQINNIIEITINSTIQSFAGTPNDNPPQNLAAAIGSQPTGGTQLNRRFTGNIDNVFIWNRLLTIEERDYLVNNIVSYSGIIVPQGVVTIGTITVTDTTASVPYTYSLSDQTGFEYRLNGEGSITPSNSSPISLISLAAGTSYTIEVRAVNGMGAGVWSSSTPFTTQSLPSETGGYFVSVSGNDSNDGLSSSTPWATLAKVNATSFVAGDIVKFKRGDSWYGSLVPSTSGTVGNPITFRDYGLGEKPIINGWKNITGWVDEGGGIWSKTDPDFPVNLQLVIVDEEVKPKGRFPKTGWLTTTSAVGNTSVTSTSLTNSPNYTGGEVVILKKTWVVETGNISNHSGGTITYSGTSTEEAGVWWGFFIQNHTNCLTQLGEWRFDSVAKKLFMYFGSEDPAFRVVKVSIINTLINMTDKNHLRFENLDTQGSHLHNYYFFGSGNSKIINCNIGYSGLHGIFMLHNGGNQPDYIDIEDCTITNCFSSSIRGNGSRFINVRRNHITFNNMVLGTPQQGNNQGGAVALGHDTFRNGNYNIENNYIENVGYNGIHVAGSNVLIQRNVIKGVCKTREDGGAVYLYGAKELSTDLYNTNRIIRENFCFDNVPNTNPTPYGQREVYDFYFDDGSRNFICDFNLSANGYCGIYVHNSRDFTINNNTAYNNSWAQIFLGDDTTLGTEDGNIQNVNIYNNQFYALGSALILRLNDTTSSISHLGIINTNHYLKPDGGVMIKKLINFGSDQDFTSVAAWTSAYGFDANTISSFTVSIISRLFHNQTLESQSVNIGTNRKDVNGVAVSSPQTIQPFRSLLLLEGEGGGDIIPTTPEQFKINSFGVYSSTTTTDTITFNNAIAGELLVIMSHGYDITNSTISTPTGWTLVSTNGRLKLFSRVKEVGDSPSVIFPRTGTENYFEHSLMGFSISGSLSTITVGAMGSPPWAEDLVIPSVNHPNSNRAIAVAHSGSRYSHLNLQTYSAGWTRQERYERSTGNTQVASWATKELPLGGATGTATVNNNSDIQGIIFTIEAVPAVKRIKIKSGDSFSEFNSSVKIAGAQEIRPSKVKVNGIFVAI